MDDGFEGGPMSTQVERCLDLLELLAETPEGLRLVDIATRLDLPKSAAHRLLAVLVERGFVKPDAATQRYRMALRLAVLGSFFLWGTGIAERCQPVLDEMATLTGELVRLAVVEGDDIVWVAEAQGARRGLRYDSKYNRDVNLHVTATGKAWLATLPEEAAARLVLRRGFGEPCEFGPRGVRTLSDLLAELRRTRERGFAIAFEEGEPGMAAVAAAVPNPVAGGPTLGTISAAGPSVRLTMERMTAFGPNLVEAARTLASLWPPSRLGRAATLELAEKSA
jgi:DNA-binding IclR family transcriptional regulator